MLEVILFIILLSPLYIMLILQIKYPRETILWGRRWMYNEEPDISDAAIKYEKIAAIIGIIILTFTFLIWILQEL